MVIAKAYVSALPETYEGWAKNVGVEYPVTARLLHSLFRGLCAMHNGGTTGQNADRESRSLSLSEPAVGTFMSWKCGRGIKLIDRWIDLQKKL